MKIKKVTNSLSEDLMSPLPDVQRVWLRRGATIILSIYVILLGSIFGILQALREWYKECW